MALIQCHECSKEISENAVTCPSCGAPVDAVASKAKAKKSENRKVIIALVIIVLFVSWLFSGDDEPEPVAQSTDTKAVAKPAPKVIRQKPVVSKTLLMTRQETINRINKINVKYDLPKLKKSTKSDKCKAGKLCSLSYGAGKYLSYLITTNANEKNVGDVLLVSSGDGSNLSSQKIMLGYGALIETLSPYDDKETRGAAVLHLVEEFSKGRKGTYHVGNIKYQISNMQDMGIWLHATPRIAFEGLPEKLAESLSSYNFMQVSAKNGKLEMWLKKPEINTGMFRGMVQTVCSYLWLENKKDWGGVDYQNVELINNTGTLAMNYTGGAKGCSQLGKIKGTEKQKGIEFWKANSTRLSG